MTPLLGTKTQSAPVGAKSGGDRRAARSLLSCALWRGMGRLWRGMGGMGCPEPLSAHRPHRQQRLSGFHETRDTRHESRLFFESQLPCPRFPTISHDFPAFPGISRPPPTPLRRSSVHAPSAFLGQPHGTAAPARSLLSCALWRSMGRLWRGMGGMGRPEPLSAHRPHQQQDLSGFHETRDPRPGYCQARGKCQREFPGFHETRDTKHESRLLCFCRCFPARCGAAWGGYGAAWAAAVPRAGNTACRFSPATRHATWFFPVPAATSRRATPSPANRFSRITKHETRNTAFILPYPPFPTISRHFPLFLGGWGGAPERVFKRRCGKIPQKCTKSRIRGRLHGVYRQPRLPPPSRILGLRPTQNELMMRKEDVLDRVDQSAYDRFFYPGDRDELRHVHVAHDDRVAIFWLACIFHHVARRSA